MSIKTIKLASLLLIQTAVWGQSRYWVDKNLAHDQQIEARFCSEWLDLCSAELDETEVNLLRLLDPGIRPIESYTTLRTDKSALGFALEQIHAEVLLEKGLTGKGVKVGIIDGGFMDAKKWESLSHFFDENRIAYYKDFVTPKMEPYTGSLSLDDIHGTEVWQLVGGFNREKNIQFGIATDATLFLARTDHGGYEKRLEEDFLIQAMEEMHAQGVRLINLSLGYNKGYNNPRENYTPMQMDGVTSILARAVDTAFYRKNMLVVVSAGNEARDPTWRYLVTPADARGALTVGASKMNIWEKMDYSSTGTPGLSFVKPNISCFSTEGTSFAAPIITGLAAAIMQYDSSLTAPEIRDIIQQAGHFYPHANDYIGHGVPDCNRILALLEGKEPTRVRELEVSKKSAIFKQPIERNYVVVYHKQDHHVLDRQIYRPNSKKLKVTRPKEGNRSSVMIDNKVTEIFWKD